MGGETLQPAQLVVELRPGCGIAVRQIQAPDRQPMHRRLDVAAVEVFRISRQRAPHLHRLGAAREDRDAVPAFLSVPDHPVTGIPNGAFRKLLLRGFEFLKANDVGSGFSEPALQSGKACADAIDVVGNDSHYWVSLARRWRVARFSSRSTRDLACNG